MKQYANLEIWLFTLKKYCMYFKIKLFVSSFTLLLGFPHQSPELINMLINTYLESYFSHHTNCFISSMPNKNDNKRRRVVATYLQCDTNWRCTVSIDCDPSWIDHWPKGTETMNTFLGDDFSTYMAWRDNIRKYKVYQNIADDSLDDIKERLV